MSRRGRASSCWASLTRGGGLLAVFAAFTAFAAPYNQYPFAAGDTYLASAEQFEPWAEVLQRHEAQLPQIKACATERKHCRGRLRSLNHLLERAAPLSEREQISLVNLYVNRTKYDDDRPTRIYDEDGNKIGVTRNGWATLYEFLTKRGDCEDYATSKYFILRELGFAAADMRVVVTYERRLRGHHAVLALKVSDDEVWLLDSDNTIRKNYHGGYRYVYAMNENSVWDHRDDYLGNRDTQGGGVR